MAASSIRSLAILPFGSRSAAPEFQHMAGGLHDAIIGELGRRPELRVVSRTSVVAMSERPVTLPEVANLLGVDGVVEGSLIEARGRLEFVLDLYHGASDTHLWGGTFESAVGDPLALRRSAVDAMLSALSTTDPADRASGGPGLDPEVQRDLLSGRYHRSLGGIEALQQAAIHYTAAARRDSSVAEAHSGLASTLLLALVAGGQFEDRQVERARRAARQAIDLDETQAEAWTVLGALSHLEDGNWDAAEAAYTRAVEHGPGLPMPHAWWGTYLIESGRLDEGLTELERAVSLDPLAPGRRAGMALALLMDGRAEEALDWIRVEPVGPEPPSVARVRERILLELGRTDAVASSLRSRLSSDGVADPDWTEPADPYAYWTDLLRSDADLNPLDRARALAATGQSAAAMDLLRRQVIRTVSQPAFLIHDPIWDPLRRDPEWDALLDDLDLSRYREETP